MKAVYDFRRTGKPLTTNKKIRVDENGFENFDDYLSESGKHYYILYNIYHAGPWL